MKAGWTKATLGDAFQTSTGCTPPKSNPDFYGQFIPLVKPPELCDSTVDSAEDGLSEAGAHVARTLPPRSILVSCIGNLGKIGMNIVPVAFNQQINAIHPDDHKALPEFMFFQTLSEQFREQLKAMASGTTVPIVNKSKFNSIEIVLPPLPEQQRIVTLLDEAFDGITTAKANAEKNLQNARAIFESHLQSVFTQTGKGWTKTTLGKATGGVFTGPFGSLLHKSDYVANGIPLVNPAHITDVGIEPDFRKTISESTALKLSNYIMRKGDVVIGRRGEMGRCALVTEAEDGWLCGTGSFYIKSSPRCDSSYLVRFLRSDSCRRRLEKIAGGAVMPNLSNADLSNLSFDLPSTEIQKAIGEEIDAIAKETQHLESIYQQKLASLAELKTSLLHRAFSGDL